MNFDYEIVVIGGGPGGYVAAIKAAQLGKKTCIIESKHFGGTCLNEGCIPTKVFLKSAAVLEEMKQSSQFGIEGGCGDKAEISMPKVQMRKTAVINQLVNGVQGLLKMNKVDIIKAEAAFLDEHTVKAGDSIVTSEYFIIATGSKAVIPAFIKQEGKNNIMTSREILELDHVPESITIIGGGVVGIEFAFFFSKAGCKVTVVELMDSILPMVDTEISRMAQQNMKKQGVNFILGAAVKEIKDNVVVYEKNGEKGTVSAETILISVGRTPNTDGLGAEKIGLKFEKNAIMTDKSLKTNIDNIYAIGDVNGKSLLAHTASHEGLIAVQNICGAESVEMCYDNIPSCIYLEPEIAAIGLTEKQAKEVYGDMISVGRFPMMANGKSLIEGNVTGTFKLIINKQTDAVLGAHLYGNHATEMIGEIAAVMTNGITAKQMLEVVHPHPSVNEAIGEMFMSACDKHTIHAG